MKLFLIISFFLTGVSFKSSGQDRDNLIRPFYILMINPDKANIADSLKVWADSIERKNLREYYNSLKSFENSKKDGDENWRKEMDSLILETKSREKEEINFKYYHELSYILRAELSKLFNADYWINWRKISLSRQSVINVQIINHSDVFTGDLEKLGQHFKVDYILTFKNIRTDKKKGIGTLTYTIQLYWTKQKKVILDKEIEGNAPVDNYKYLYQIYSSDNDENIFHESGVSCANYLECMLTSAIRFSTEEVYREIYKRQKK
jgi:hypothetical protein